MTFQKLNIRDEKLFDAIATESIKKMDGFNPQELSNVAMTFQELNIRNVKLFDAIARESLKKIDEFIPQNLSNTAMAYQKMDIHAPELFDAIASESLQRIDKFHPQALSHMAMAYQEMEVPHLFDALVNETIKKIKTFKKVDFIMMADALDISGFQLNNEQSEQLQPYFENIQAVPGAGPIHRLFIADEFTSEFGDLMISNHH